MADKNPEEMSMDELEAAITGALETEPETPEQPPVKEEPKAEEPADPEKPDDEEEKPKEAAEEEKPEPEKPKAYTYTASDGTMYSADTSEALFRKVSKALDHTKSHARIVEAENKELKAKTESRPAETPAQQPEAEAPKYDHTEYLKLLEKDGLKAAEYAKQFDPDFQELREMREKVRQREEVERQQSQLSSEVQKFYAQTDYAEHETPELNALMQRRLKETGRSNNADALLATYYELKISGQVPGPQGVPPDPTPKAPPPSAVGAAATEPPPKNYDRMTDEEFLKEMEKAGITTFQ